MENKIEKIKKSMSGCPLLVKSVFAQSKMNDSRNYPQLKQVIDRFEGSCLDMDIFWKKTKALKLKQEKLAELFHFIIEILHKWFSKNPQQVDCILKKDLVVIEGEIFERKFYGIKPDEQAGIEYFKKTASLAKNLINHLNSQPYSRLELDDAHPSILASRLNLSIILDKAFRLSQRKRASDTVRSRKSKIEKSGARFLIKKTSVKMRELFNNPHHELVATIVNVAFECTIDAGYVQKVPRD